MKWFSIGVLFVTLITGCSQSSASSSPILPEASPTTQIADSINPTTNPTTVPTQESPEVSPTKVTEITDQSFDTNLESRGKVRFVSAKQVNEGGRTELLLTLQDPQKAVIYAFPKPKLTDGWEFKSVKAVAFRDVNQDGKKDVIVLADYLTGADAEGNVPIIAATTFIQQNKQFFSDFDSDNDLYSDGSVSTVKDVTAYYKEKSKRGQLCRKVLTTNMAENDIAQAYYAEYEKQGFNLSEAGQDQMFGDIGSCFEQETDRLLADNSELKSKSIEIYKAIAESISHLSTIQYIRNGGGTMWTHNGNREIGFYHYYVYQYVKVKIKGSVAAAQEYDRLEKKVDSQMETLRKKGVQGLEEFAKPEEVKAAAKQFHDEYLGLKASIQKFKKLTAEKDKACLFLFSTLVNRVG